MAIYMRDCDQCRARRIARLPRVVAGAQMKRYRLILGDEAADVIKAEVVVERARLVASNQL